MRKYLTFLLLGLCMAVMGQEKRLYFFPDFLPTRIVYQGGATYRVQANYDVANQKMMYQQDGQLMELTHPQLVDTIFTGGRKWVFHDGQFCEVIRRPSGAETLIGWHMTKIQVGYEGALGTVSQAPTQKVELGGNFGMGSFTGDSGGGMYNGSFGVNDQVGSGNMMDVWHNRNSNVYYFTKGAKEYKIKSIKQVYKAFPDRKDEMRQYFSDHHLDMLTAENALAVIDYLQSLP